MGSVSKLISTKIENFVIGVIEKRIGFKLEHPFYSPAGVDAVPLPNDKMFIQQKDGSGNYVILGSLMISQGAKEGELILYSRDSGGAVKSKIYLNQAGEVVLNDGTDYAVAFNDLKTAYNQLKTDHDSLALKYSAHTHPYVDTPVGPSVTSPTLSTEGPSSGNIDPAKVEKVRLP